MRNLFFFLFLSLGLLVSSCNKDPLPLSIVDTPEKGTSIVYINGKQVSYQHSTRKVDSSRIHLDFFEKRNNNTETRVFSFGFMQKREGDFDFTVTPNLISPVPEESVKVGFSHTVEEDLEGYKYGFDFDEQNFFHVEQLDTLERTIKGEGRVGFLLFNENGWSFPDLPEHMEIEFKFYVYY